MQKANPAHLLEDARLFLRPTAEYICAISAALCARNILSISKFSYEESLPPAASER
jgi:hypothetical protein